jgi:predicted Zn-dependent protease
MLGLMNILKSATQSNGRPPEFLSSHPLPDTRLQRISDQIKSDYPNGIPDTLTKGESL